MRTALLSLALLALCACGSAPTPPGPDAPIERGPKAIALDGDPNGIWWDAATKTLFMADDQNNRVLKWTDAGGVSLVADLPPAPANGAGLGDLVRMPDGTLVVVRFGGGTAGDVVFVRPDGTSGIVPNLKPERRRIGLTLAQDGHLYVGYFVRVSNVNVGSVARLTLDGTEQEVIGALQKPVGVLAVGDSLFVSDQLAGKVYRAPLAAPQEYTTYATLPSPDLLAVGPGGLLLTGSRQGKVFSIAPTGEVAVMASGYQEPHGLAYDEENKRLFIADHDGDTSDGATHFLRIIPVE
ncbi:SMP-30/gluconolactonase/LRE family protein [Archangium violaceum]|uniref:SMP-30/gluconolactonase/LRE family protein n=1 Tax=Archangium violaceum TaxID=83451 RepID=UPI0036DCC21E